MTGYKASSNLSSGAAAVTSQVTLLSVIAPDLNTKVAVDTSQKVDANGPGAVGLAQQQKAGLAQVGQEIGRTKAAAVEQIKSAQNEIISACKANGVQEGEAFPDTAMAPNSGAELLIGAVSGKGGGSLATAMLKGSNNVSLAGDVAAGMSDRPQEEVLSAIKDTLIANSTPANPNETFGGIIVDAGEAPQMDDALSIDWENVLTQRPDALEHIMYFSEDNLDAWPELAELDAAESQVEQMMAELTAIELMVEAQYSADGVEIAGELPNGFPVNAANADTFLPIASLPAEEREYIKSVGAHIDRSSPNQDLENDLLRMAQPSMASSMMA